MPGVDHILAQTWDHVRDGAILLFHDGSGDRSQTMEAVRILLDKLTSDGYELVTVSELLARRSRWIGCDDRIDGAAFAGCGWNVPLAACR